MNPLVVICIIMGIIFLILGILFAILKEKGALLISGFNSFSKEQRKNYDQEAISKDMRNIFFIWFIIFTIGAILSYYISIYFSIVSLVIWGISIIKLIKFDNEKAFAKYKKI